MDLLYGSDHTYEGFNIQISMNDSLKILLRIKSTNEFYFPLKVCYLLYTADDLSTLPYLLLC